MLVPDRYETDALVASGLSNEADGDILDLALNINPFGPPPGSVRAAASTLSHVHEYPPVDATELRRAVAKWHGVASECLSFGCGLDEVIKLLVHAWTNPGDRVLVHVPTFPRYELELRAHGAHLVFVTSPTPWETDCSAIGKTLRARRVTTAFLCTPNNPTAARIDIGSVEELASEFPHVQFIVDEAMIYPTQQGAVPLVGRFSNMAVLRTFSKYFGLAGLRIGYVVADPARISLVETIRPPFNVSQVGIAAAVAALEEDQDFLRESHDAIAAELEFVVSSLRSMMPSWVLHHGESNMIMVETPGVSSTAMAGELLRRGVRVVDGRTFRGLETTDSLRVSLGDRTANSRFLGALAQAWSVLRERVEEVP
jgi:histidinol-phosphate aminotransferase